MLHAVHENTISGGLSIEKRVAERIYGFFRGLDYYADYPEYLSLSNISDDALGRKNVLALVKGEKGRSRKTVVLIGRTYTVGIEDYGNIREYATLPESPKELFRDEDLDEETMRDLESDDWIFSRGIFDMKAEVAAHLALMKKLSENAGELEGNVVFMNRLLKLTADCFSKNPSADSRPKGLVCMPSSKFLRCLSLYVPCRSFYPHTLPCCPHRSTLTKLL